jgi:hypothetical protein
MLIPVAPGSTIETDSRQFVQLRKRTRMSVLRVTGDFAPVGRGMPRESSGCLIIGVYG